MAMAMVMGRSRSRREALNQSQSERHGGGGGLLFPIRLSSPKSLIRKIMVVIALLPPIFLHFRLRRLHQIQLNKCSWLHNPPNTVCAHGGDSSNAFPNTEKEPVPITRGFDTQVSLYNLIDRAAAYQARMLPYERPLPLLEDGPRRKLQRKKQL